MEGDEDQEYSANNYQIIPDLSFGRENVPVKLVADVSQIELNEDNFPYFNYITESKPTVGIQLEEDLYRLPCCACEDRCDPLTCSCCKSGPFFDEDHCLVQTDNRSILSCNSNCACSTDCPQRCVAGGVTLPLQVSWMGKKGWSLRCEADISAGRFVIEYVGEIVSDAEAEARGNRNEGMFLLDLSSGEGGGRKTRCLDAKWFGNASRFINHSCDPNLLARIVHVNSHDEFTPRVVFVARRNIKQFEELTFDYGIIENRKKSLGGDAYRIRCQCGVPSCRGIDL